MTEHRQYYGFLDLVRLYCALLIVFIHMGFGNSLSIVPCLSRQGVPFFFLASGFFFSRNARKSNDIKRTVICYINPILLVYSFWILLWMPSTVAEYRHLYSESVVTLIAVLCRRILLAGIAPYWYLLVLAEGILVLAWVIHGNRESVGTVVCVLGIVLYLIYGFQEVNNHNGIVYRLFYMVFSWNNNVIMSGFPLLYLGSLMERHEDRITNMNFWVILVLYLISVAAAFLLYSKDQNLFCIPFGVIQACLLFILCVVSGSFQQRIPVKIGKNARNLSSVIFLTHTVFLTLLGHGLHIWNSVMRYGVTVLSACVLFWLVKKLHWRPLESLLLIKQ